MASRADRASALRGFASRLDKKFSKVKVDLIKLGLELGQLDMDEEDRAAYEHDFEGAAAVLRGAIDGAFETQRGKLLVLADSLEYAAASPPATASAAPTASPPTGTSGRPEGYKDGMLPADPDRREGGTPRFLRPGRG